MKVVLATLVALGACAEMDSAKGQTPGSHAALYTNGTIRMDEDRRIFIYYDRNPTQAIGSSPGEPSYGYYIELARGLHPGDQKRIYTDNGWYAKNEDGSFTMEGLAGVPGGTGVIVQTTVTPSQAGYACLNNILRASEIGRRYPYLNYDRDRVEACQNGEPEPPPPPT